MYMYISLIFTFPKECRNVVDTHRYIDAQVGGEHTDVDAHIDTDITRSSGSCVAMGVQADPGRPSRCSYMYLPYLKLTYILECSSVFFLSFFVSFLSRLMDVDVNS